MIGVTAGRIITERLDLRLPARAGFAEADLAQDAIKVAVVARHGKNGNIGRGFVHGFGLQRGAIASSVGHDSHNITVVGVDDADMAAAVNRLIAMQGGFAVAAGGAVTAELALPVAGLMSLEPFETVRGATDAAAASRQGARLHAAGAVPAGRLPAAAGDPASEDHRSRPVRRRPLRAGVGARPLLSLLAGEAVRGAD